MTSGRHIACTKSQPFDIWQNQREDNCVQKAFVITNLQILIPPFQTKTRSSILPSGNPSSTSPCMTPKVQHSPKIV
jgi:hypothetical protein